MATYYTVQYYDSRGSWENSFVPGNGDIASEDAAIIAARARRAAQTDLKTYRVVRNNDGVTVWEIDQYGLEIRRSGAYSSTAVSPPSGEDKGMAPLNVTRTKLIAALTDAQKELTRKHEEARAEMLAAFDAWAALVRENATAATLETYVGDDRNSRDGKWIGNTHAAAVVDETIAKQLRVLKMSEDKTIEVTPSDDFYRYL